jgi:GGDEF domain-containing protein
LTIDGKNSKQSTRHPTPATAEWLLWNLYALVGATILQSTLVLLGHEPAQAVWLLVLLAAAVGQGLLLPSRFAWFGALAAVVLWVMFRQATGVWVQAQLLQSMLEIAGLALSVLLAVRLRQVWESLQQSLNDLQILRNMLVAGEAGTGLLPRQVAELRLMEEVDRARQFRRPLGLLLVEIEHLPDALPDWVEAREVHQAAVRQVATASLVHDIPFRVDTNCLGLILPERDWDTLYRDSEAIIDAIRGALFLDEKGRSHEVSRYARLSFGLGTYQGETSGTIDLLRAAQDSLSIGRDLADIGETSVSAFAMPATPIVASRVVAADEEE